MRQPLDELFAEDKDANLNLSAFFNPWAIRHTNDAPDPYSSTLASPYSLHRHPVLFFACHHSDSQGASTMEWVTPQHEEIDLNCEVSSYANAEL